MKNRIFLISAGVALAVSAVASGCSEGETRPPRGQEFAVAVSGDGNGTARATVNGVEIEKAVEDVTVAVTAEPSSGYSFRQWVVISGGFVLDDAKANPAVFAMPRGRVEIRAEFDREYGITFLYSEYGKIGATVGGKPVTRAKEGETVTVTATPHPFCTFGRWVVEGEGCELSDPWENPVTFTMPAWPVEIGGEFRPEYVAFEDAFPDANFRAEIAEYYDMDGDMRMSPKERALVSATTLLGVGKPSGQEEGRLIADLTGIGYFTALKTLNCPNNRLTGLDLSQNGSLTTLSCYGNRINALDVSVVPGLMSLNCSYNRIDRLDLSGNAALRTLYCGGNPLSSLDVSANAELYRIDCCDTRLTVLDVSGNAQLAVIVCGRMRSDEAPPLEITVRGDATLGLNGIFVYVHDGEGGSAQIEEFGPSGSKRGVTVYKAGERQGSDFAGER